MYLNPRTLKQMTIEELEVIEQELHEMEEDKSDSSIYSLKMNVYEEMYHRINKLVRAKKEKKSYLEYVRKKLIFTYIHYGTYLKMQNEKNDYDAFRCLEKSLKYDNNNPIAAYRLGFLSYKHKNYKNALNYFQKALDSQNNHKVNDYRLNDKQLVNAHLYLTNSALYIAKVTYENIKTLPENSHQELPNYEFSTMYNSLKDNEQYLEKHAFYKISQTESITCSKEECEETITHEPPNTIILYFNDRNIKLIFNENEVILSENQGKIFRHLLTKSSQDVPATRFTLHHFFLDSNVKGEVNKKTFTKAISRLKEKLEACNIPSIIQTTNYRKETAYYYNGKLPYIVMYRVDEEIEYD